MENKEFKFILDGEPKRVSALHLLDACKRIMEAYPETRKLTMSDIKLKQI